MDWRYVPQVSVDGIPDSRKVYTIPSEQGVRFLIVYRGKMVFTKAYATPEDGERCLLQDYLAHQGLAVADGCKFCGKVIETDNKRAIFCSRECQKRWHAREQTKRKTAARRAVR